MVKGQSCRIKGCDDKTSSRHRFPNPKTRIDCYHKWIKACGDSYIASLPPQQVYETYRVCHAHFDDRDESTNSFLLKSAVPHLNLPSDSLENLHQSSVVPSTSSGEGVSMAETHYLIQSSGSHEDVSVTEVPHSHGKNFTAPKDRRPLLQAVNVRRRMKAAGMNPGPVKATSQEVAAEAKKVTAEVNKVIVEVNRATAAAPVTPSASIPTITISQNEMLSYVSHDTDTSNTCEDEESLRGRFGWELIGTNHIPYIIRTGKKYCSVRMVELKVLNKDYFKLLHGDIFNFTCIFSYYMSTAEIHLLNTINCMHCDYQFGNKQFTDKDLIVRLDDVIELCHFLDACYKKLSDHNTNFLDRCGFFRINQSSVVPYTVCLEDKYVPLFYFEGETDTLNLKAHKLEGWDLAYLKFCCKVQGIRYELFSHDSCSVTSIDNLKKFFPTNTVFEEYWPSEDSSSLLINGKTGNKVGPWYRKPAEHPIVQTTTSKTSTKAKASTRYLQKIEAINGSCGVRPATPTTETRTSTLRRLQSRNIGSLPPLIMLNKERNSLEQGETPVTLLNGQSQYKNKRKTRQSVNDSSAISIVQSNLPTSIVEPPQTQPQPPTDDTPVPYKMQMVLVDSRIISCINSKPYVHTDFLVTIPDLIEHIFNDVPVQSCIDAMQVLGIGLVPGNESQLHILCENGKCPNISDGVPLVSVGVVLLYMSQLKYMLGKLTSSEDVEKQLFDS